MGTVANGRTTNRLDVQEMNQQSAERARKEERSETIGRFITVRTE
ncbi:hypothetical protein [Bacillus sp. 28A-2]|nr:hypothetical protein [Bacillus sp. 28A-2]